MNLQRSTLYRSLKTLPLTLSSIGYCLALLFFATGCAGYKLGPSNGLAAGERTLEVKPFRNSTIEPRLSEYVTSSLRKQLQQEGTYRLETHDTADIVITGEITNFRRSALSLQPSDVRTVRDYYLFLTATVDAVDRTTGRKLLHRALSGRTAIRVGADLTSAERQAIPLLADDLARQATSLIVGGTW
jgi:hypothetical protein